MPSIRILRIAAAGVGALAFAGCAAHSARLPAVNMRFYETPPEAAPTERLNETFTLNATLIGNAATGFHTPAELLKAAEDTSGQGSPQKLLQAGRSVVPGDAVTLVATVRSHEASGGSTRDLAQYLLALTCRDAALDEPGDLQGCKGYIMRVTRTWPAEVYGIDEATVTLIPEGGTAKGRIRAKSVPGGFKAELEGEFTASIVQVQPAAAPPEAAPTAATGAP